MIKYYTWYQEHRLDKNERVFLFAIKTPESSSEMLMNRWAYINLRTRDDKLTKLWINTGFVKPEQLVVCDESPSDKKYVGHYLRGNKGKIIKDYFDTFGPK